MTKKSPAEEEWMDLALAEAEHHDIRWVAPDELGTLQPPMSGAVTWYCRQALAEVR